MYKECKRRIGNEPEPQFMSQREDGFNKHGKKYITRSALQVIFFKSEHMHDSHSNLQHVNS